MQKYKMQTNLDGIIGKGGFGTVVKAVNNHNQPVAIKIIKKSLLQCRPELKKYLESEIEMNRRIQTWNSPFFTKMIENYDTHDSIFIVMQFCNQGDLLQYSTNHKLTYDQIIEMVFQIGLALKKLHSEKIIHRDLKLENILIHDGLPKLCDFGFSTDNYFPGTVLGSCLYMAPELLAGNGYDSKVDIWALNTVLYRLLSGGHFFKGSTNARLEKNIRKQVFRISYQFTQTWPSDVRDLLEKGYQKNPTCRLDIEEYLQHPVFQHLHFKYQNFEKLLQVKIQKTPKNKNHKNQNIKKAKAGEYRIKFSLFRDFLGTIENYYEVSVDVRSLDQELSFMCFKKYLQIYIALRNALFTDKRKNSICLKFHLKRIKPKHIQQFFMRSKGKSLRNRIETNLKEKLILYKKYKEQIDFSQLANLKRIRNPEFLDVDLSKLTRERIASFYYANLNSNQKCLSQQVIEKLRKVNQFEREFNKDLDGYLSGY